MCRHLFVAALLVSALSSDLRAQAAGSDAARIVGTWRLVTFQADSGAMAARGKHPTGLLIYTPTGHMAAQIQPDRNRPSWPPRTVPSPQQALDALNGYTAYFGTYDLDEKAHTITHRREGALNFDAVNYVRRYQFDGPDRLVLLPVERPESRLVWERVK